MCTAVLEWVHVRILLWGAEKFLREVIAWSGLWLSYGLSGGSFSGSWFGQVRWEPSECSRASEAGQRLIGEIERSGLADLSRAQRRPAAFTWSTPNDPPLGRCMRSTDPMRGQATGGENKEGGTNCQVEPR